jgi:phosphatidylglycerol lysyltransferase
LDERAGNGAAKRSRLSLLQPFWSVLVVALVAVFVWRQRAELTQAIRELRLADWHWLVLVVASALLMHGFLTWTLSAILERIGRKIPFQVALMTHTEREMVATVMPVGGAASYVTLVSRFGPYGVTGNDAALATMVYGVVGHLSFVAVAIPAMIALIATHNTTGSMLIAALAFLVLAISVTVALVALLRGKRLPVTFEKRLPAFVAEFEDVTRTTTLSARALAAPFASSLTADLFGVVSMWAALQAVRADAPLFTALAAYTVGTMLQLVAPVFQGFGIVEVSVIVLLERLGVPLPQAIGATILYRLVDVWLPVVLGFGVYARGQRRLRGLPAHLPAIWTALSGVLALASVLPVRVHIPHVDFARASGVGMLHPYHLDRTFTLVAGFLLVVLSVRLVRRQHAAWVAALALSSVLTALYIARDYDDIGALFSGTNVAILLIYRSRFRVRSDIPTLRRGVYVLAASFSATYFFGVASLWLADRRHFGRELSLASSLRTARDIYFGFGNGGLVARTARGEWILDSMHLLGALALVVSVLAMLQPIVWRHRVQRAETERARRIIERFGQSDLDRFKYWPDKFQFFGPSDRGCVSFGLSGRVAVVLGDPTASDGAMFAETLDDFLDACDVNGWEPAFHQVDSTHLDDYRARGLTSLMIGQSAVILLDTFSLSGKSMHSLRSTLNRAQRRGQHVDFTEPPFSDELLSELNEISDEWLTLERRRERTFTLGQFEPGYVRASPVLVLRSAEGRAEAFINLIPDGAPGELTFDLMRHRIDVPNGSMDVLMLALIDYGRAQGFSRLSLGMVPFVSPESSDSAAAADRAIAQLARPMSRFFASERLFAYKDKFHPIWEPRYLVVRSVTRLPQVALALTRLSEIEDRSLWRHIWPLSLRPPTQRRTLDEPAHAAEESAYAG